MTQNPGEFQTDELHSIVDEIIQMSRKMGADAVEAGVSVEHGLSTTVRMGEVETIEHNRDKGLGLTVYFRDAEGLRKGSASTSDMRRDSIRETVKAACDIAKYTQADVCAGLAPAERMATDIPELDLYHPWSIDAEQAIELATECEAAARAYDGRISNSDGATLNSHQGYRVYGNSHGFLAGYPSSRHSVSCVMIAEDAKGMQRDYWYSSARDAQQLESMQHIGETAAQRTIQRLSPRGLATQQIPILFSAEVASSLIGHFTAAIRGGALYRKSSFLLDSLGQQVFRPGIHIHEQPHLSAALGSAPFDNEGVATQTRDVVKGGIVQGYVLDAYSACKLGMETTGNAGGLHNLTVEPGTMDQTQLIKTMGTGLLVTDLMGQGVNMVTGDYSRGAAGFWVENGEIQYPVDEVTIAGNLAQMFKDLAEVGNDVDLRGNTRCGSLLVEKMTVAGEG